MIRLGNKFDTPHVLRMLHNFRKMNPIESLTEMGDDDHVSSLYNAIIHGRGLALIAEKDVPIGLLLAIGNQNIWDPKLLHLQEFAYWVEPDWRNTTIGYRLLAKYNEYAKKLVEQKRVSFYKMTKTTKSPDLDFTRFGYNKVEETWVAGV